MKHQLIELHQQIAQLHSDMTWYFVATAVIIIFWGSLNLLGGRG